MILRVLSYLLCLNPVLLLKKDLVPHSDSLEKILAKTVFKNLTLDEDTVFDFLQGQGVAPVNDLKTLQILAQHLELRPLDLNTLGAIIDVEKAKESSKNVRRFFTEDNSYEIYHKNERPDLVNKTMEFMLQSIYATRYRMDASRPYRKKLDMNMDYRLGVLYGSLTEMMIKLDNVYMTAKKFYSFDTKFLYYLLMYERFLSIFVDISYTVENFFHVHNQWVKISPLPTTRRPDIDPRMKTPSLDDIYNNIPDILYVEDDEYDLIATNDKASVLQYQRDNPRMYSIVYSKYRVGKLKKQTKPTTSVSFWNIGKESRIPDIKI